MKLKNYSNNKVLILKQSKFIQALEGIGDILVFETRRRNKNKNVIQGLKRIGQIVNALFNIQKTDPQKFEKIILAQEFFELYRENKEDARFRLSFNPDKYLITFSTAINQILRIHEAATESQNEEISRFATYNLNWILADISKTPNNELFVEQLLKNLSTITRIALKKQDSSIYTSSIHWYIDIVFNKLRQRAGKFDISYLALFDKYFFSSVKYIVSQEQTYLFHALVSSLIDGIFTPIQNKGKVWDYGHLILQDNFSKYQELDKEHEIESHIRELANSEDDLCTKEKLDNWIDKFKEIKRLIEPHLKELQKNKGEELEKEIMEYVESQFKYNNLVEIVFAVGAYCLFRQKPDYIRYLWEYKQPPDADASWIGHDIIPNTLDSTINLYFRTSLFERKFDFWEKHHGSELYYKQYFLLLLTKALSASSINQKRINMYENYHLPKLHIYRLGDLENSVDELVKIAEELRYRIPFLISLGFFESQINDMFDNMLIPFLKSLKTKAQVRIISLEREKKISIKKIEEFKNLVLQGFSESTTMREIFNHYKLYEDKTDEEYKGALGKCGINMVDSKAAFFEEWLIHYVGWGTQHGRSIAQGEDVHVAEEISKNCEKTNDDFEKILKNFAGLSDVIVFTTIEALYDFFAKSNCFQPVWRKAKTQSNIEGLEGWYVFENVNIPIYRFYLQKAKKQIIVLDKSKLGKWVQYSPLDNGEKSEFKKGIFFMNIQAFSENDELVRRFLKKPPEWLKKIKRRKEREAYIKGKVLIQIYERYEYRKSDAFEGFLLEIK